MLITVDLVHCYGMVWAGHSFLSVTKISGAHGHASDAVISPHHAADHILVVRFICQFFSQTGRFYEDATYNLQQYSLEYSVHVGNTHPFPRSTVYYLR